VLENATISSFPQRNGAQLALDPEIGNKSSGAKLAVP
jgi:hypothetical protein